MNCIRTVSAVAPGQNYMLWSVESPSEHLAWSILLKKSLAVPRRPMISHIHPWASAAVWGELDGASGPPLAGARGGALGEASGTVSVHLCE